MDGSHRKCAKLAKLSKYNGLVGEEQQRGRGWQVTNLHYLSFDIPLRNMVEQQGEKNCKDRNGGFKYYRARK